MWQIIKSEIDYNKHVWITVYAVAVVFFGAAVTLGGDVYMIVPNTIVPFFIGYGFLCHTRCKESRERQLCILPQSQTQYGITRMLFFALYQSVVVVLWLIAYVMSISHTPEAIWMILTANALLLTYRAVGFILEDTRQSLPSIVTVEGWVPEIIAQRVVRILVYTIMTVLLVVAVASKDGGGAVIQMDVDWAPVVDLRDFLRSPMGALLTNVMFVVVFYLSVTVSLTRKSFASSR
jgi:hypothetical protein